MLGVQVKENKNNNKDIKDEVLEAIINFSIVFFLALIPELLSHTGMPTPEILYHALLVGGLSALIFAAGNRGIRWQKERG